MRKRRISSVTVVMFLATGLLAGGEVSAASATAACTYRAQQISGLPGGVPDGQLTETDGDRHFVGWGQVASPGYPHGTVWRDGVVVANLGALNGAHSVNRSGDIVGGGGSNSSVSIFIPHGGTATRLALPAGMTRSVGNASSIGDDGLIIGTGRFDDGTHHGLSWSINTAATTVRDLGVLGTVPALQKPPALNEVSDTGGRIVGSTKPAGRFRAVTGTAGSLAPLGGVDPNLDSEATDIAGRFVLGTGTVPGQGTGSVLWENGVPRLLPVTGTATDVNSSGVVSGHTGDQAFVLDGGVRTTLPPLPGHTQARAMAVTEDGRVVGRSTTTAGEFPVAFPVVWSCA